MITASKTVELCGLQFHKVGRNQALEWILSRNRDDPFAYVVTPNVDHIVRLAKPDTADEIAAAYQTANLTLCDSKVLGLLARLRGLNVPIVTGSDLTAFFLMSPHLPEGAKIVVVGGDESTIATLCQLVPQVDFRQTIPPMGLARDRAAIEQCADFVAAQQADYVLLAVGSPQQELVAAEIARRQGVGGTALCVGAAIDFFTGKTERAPAWMQKLALEWLHRLASNPKRMWRRYLVDGPHIFKLVFKR